MNLALFARFRSHNQMMYFSAKMFRLSATFLAPPLPHISKQSGILPPILPSVDSSLITSSLDDEQQVSQDELTITTNETTTTRQALLKRSEPIPIPSSFIVQSMSAAGNAASLPKT